MRLLFWIGLIVLVGFAIRSKVRAMMREAEKNGGRRASRRERPVPQIEAMTQCAHCGIFFPASEAIQADGQDYCSPAHVRLPRDQSLQ